MVCFYALGVMSAVAKRQGFGSYLDVFFRENSSYFDDYQAPETIGDKI